MTKNIPIIILTVLETNILDCYEAGATKYLNKPVTPKILRAEVRDALENPEPLMSDEA
jgi:DNA-binding response OmpR family regulator